VYWSGDNEKENEFNPKVLKRSTESTTASEKVRYSERERFETFAGRWLTRICGRVPHDISALFEPMEPAER
jgi:hypothetical protein